jgi:hypothetical protein
VQLLQQAQQAQQAQQTQQQQICKYFVHGFCREVSGAEVQGVVGYPPVWGVPPRLPALPAAPLAGTSAPGIFQPGASAGISVQLQAIDWE